MKSQTKGRFFFHVLNPSIPLEKQRRVIQKRLQWFRHVERDRGWSAKAGGGNGCVPGGRPVGRSRTLRRTVQQDMEVMDIEEGLALD